MNKQNINIWLGIFFIAIGIIWLLDNFDLFFFGISVRSLIFSWYTFAIIFGIIIISHNPRSFWGYFWLVIGLMSFVKHLEFLPFFSFFTFGNLWPILIILIGTWMILSMNEKNSMKNFSSTNQDQNYDIIFSQNIFHENTLNENVQFTSMKKIISTDELKGGKINVMFGGLVLDLTKCKLANGDNILDISIMFGSIEIHVPQDWVINSSVSTTFGSYQDKRFFIPSDAKKDSPLWIKGTVAFGGCEISY